MGVQGRKKFREGFMAVATYVMDLPEKKKMILTLREGSGWNREKHLRADDQVEYLR